LANRCLIIRWPRSNRRNERFNAVPLTLLLPLFSIHALAILLIQEEIASDFNDLGRLLLGGFVLAVAVAIGFTFVRLRLRDKKVATPEFLSINSVEREE
jgi:hypothetical protein